jgi:hypothetical protein
VHSFDLVEGLVIEDRPPGLADVDEALLYQIVPSSPGR